LVIDRLSEMICGFVPDEDRDYTFDLNVAGVSRPRLGVNVQELSSHSADYLGVEDGLLVTQVQEGSVTAAAGVRQRGCGVPAPCRSTGSCWSSLFLYP